MGKKLVFHTTHTHRQTRKKVSSTSLCVHDITGTHHAGSASRSQKVGSQLGGNTPPPGGSALKNCYPGSKLYTGGETLFFSRKPDAPEDKTLYRWCGADKMGRGCYDTFGGRKLRNTLLCMITWVSDSCGPIPVERPLAGVTTSRT